MLALVPPVPDDRVTALMLELLELKPTDKLLEIGTGSGSQTHVWQKYAGEVHSVELKREYKLNDSTLGGHVYLSYGDGAKGLPDAAPFHAIVATCGVPDIPIAWPDQLAEGGRLVAPVGTNSAQRLMQYRKKGQSLIPVRVAAYVRFVMMEHE